MNRPQGMQEVELVTDDGAAPPAGPTGERPADEADRRARRRRRVLRWWPLGAVAVALLVGSQLVLDARERGRLAAARDHPGVVGYDVGPELTAEPADPVARPADGVVVGDLRIAADDVARGEPRAVLATDLRSGEEVWRTVVEDASLAAELGSIDAPWCSAGDPPVDQVTCFVQDIRATDVGGGGFELEPPVRARLVTLDPATGAVTAEREAAPRSSAVVSGDDVLLAEVVEGGLRASAQDAVTGEARWVTELPVDARALASVPHLSPSLHVSERHVVLELSQQAWAVDRADGRLEVTGAQVWVGRAERLVSHAVEDGTTRLRGADGSGDTVATGAPVTLAVDDGSVPDLDLLADVDRGSRQLHAVDPRTGRQVWEHTLVGPPESALVLLDEVLYGADGASMWALDARDGTTIWRTPRDPEVGDVAGSSSAGTWFQPLTDGQQLLLVEPEGAEDGAPSVMSAWSLASGRHLWTTPLPEETGGHVLVWEGALYGGWPEPVLLR
jgi:outer membrane protein assembly factor BamB